MAATKDDIDALADRLDQSSLRYEAAIKTLTKENDAKMGSPFSDTYTGGYNEDIVAFIENFELMANGKNLDENAMLRVLPTLLKEGALDFYRQMQDATKNNYANLRKELITQFRTDAMQRCKILELHNTKQLSTEDVNGYASRLQRLMRVAYKEEELNGDARDAVLKAIFQSGVVPQNQIAFLLQQPKTFREALDATLKSR